MSLLAALFLFSVTRAEIIERMKAPPVTKLNGLVQVYATIPSDMRREYQMPVAGFVADTCRMLYGGLRMQPKRFNEPRIVIRLGESREENTNVIAAVISTGGEGRHTRIFLPSPGFSDMRALKIETARAFYRAVKGEEISAKEGLRRLRAADPELRVEDEFAMIANWSQRGIYEQGMDDEDYLKLMRKVLKPGYVTRHDLSVFASRLRLYPYTYAAPFCGRFTSLDFDEAIRWRDDPGLRLAALVKSRQVLIFGAGHGDGLKGAAESYSKFLSALAAGKSSALELKVMLAEADVKLKNSLN